MTVQYDFPPGGHRSVDSRWLLPWGAILITLGIISVGSRGRSACAQTKPAIEKSPVQKPVLEKPVASAAATTTETAVSPVQELKPARLVFVDRHEVAFDRPGVLKAVVEEGEIVEADQVIAQLEDDIAKAVVDEASARVLNKAEILSAQKQAELAKVKFESAQESWAEYQAKSADVDEPREGKGPRNERSLPPLYPRVYLDELRLTYEAASADIGRFEKEYAVNEKGLNRAIAELKVLALRAPKAGLVVRAFKQTGEGVQSGEKVLEIISTERIRAEVEVPAVIAARLRVGMPITVAVQQPIEGMSMGLERYPARIKFIDPTINQVSQKVRLWTELDNSHGQLREGLVATIEVVSGPMPVAAPQ